MRTPSATEILALLFLSLATATLFAQYNKAPTVSEANPAINSGDRAQESEPNHRELLEKLFVQRQRQMEENSDKILRLATDLNTEINHPDPKARLEPNDTVRKAEAIAKLAKSIRQQMAANDVH